MGLILKLVANALYGLCIIAVLLVVGFAAGTWGGLVAIALLASAGFVLAYLSARRAPALYALYGLAHIALPLVFILLSAEGDPDSTATMRLYWIVILGGIYLASLAGGRLASRQLSAKEPLP